MADGDPVSVSAQQSLPSLFPRAPYIAYPVPSNWEFVQFGFCNAISWSASAAFFVTASYMQVAEWLLNISANVCAGETPVTIAGWRSAQYGGIVAKGGRGEHGPSSCAQAASSMPGTSDQKRQWDQSLTGAIDALVKDVGFAVPTLASRRGGSACECENPRGTSKYMFPVWFWI
jgi:hypothetical protein